MYLEKKKKIALIIMKMEKKNKMINKRQYS
jgi:hypothetical protein